MAITDGMKLVFADEFNKLDASPNGISTTYSDGENRVIGDYLQEYYSDSSVGVNPFSTSNGQLSITAAPSADPAATDGQTWTSGMIKTDHSFSMEYGYFEFTATLPSGSGTWPALWLMPSSGAWPPELDVMEHLGGDSAVHASVHSDVGDFNTYSTPIEVGNPSAGPHTYGVNWTPTEIDFYLDGKEVGSTATPHGFNEPMFMMASLAIAKPGVTSWGGGAGPDGSTAANSTLVLDSIKAYANQYTQDISLSDAAKATTAASTGTSYTPADTSHTPMTHDVGTGDTVATLHVSQDFFQGNAQFAVLVDGKQVGETLDASALHGQGEDTVNVHANLSAGDHTVTVQMLNDAYAWSPDTDRNLYLDSATDGHGNSLTPSLENLGYNGAQGTVTVHSDGTSSAPVSTTPVTADPAPVTSPDPAPVTTAPATDTSSHAPASHDVGTGATFATLHVSEDAFQGDAQFQVLVDGKAVGDVLTASALHGQGSDAITVHGDYGAGDHSVGIQFLNDAWDGGAGDRNLYLDGVLDSVGKSLEVANSDSRGGMFSTGDMAGASLHVDTPATSSPTSPAPVDTSSHAPATLDIGTGGQSLVLHLSEDAYQGDAQFVVKVDGQQVGGTLTASALHGQGTDTVTLHGDFGDGLHVASLEFTNDAWDGGSGDRNIHVESVTTGDGHTSGVYSAGSWADGADLMSTGDTAFVGFASFQGQMHVTDYALH